MLSREEQIIAFLRQAGWGSARRVAIPGDASFRRYERLTDGSRTAILMDAPLETPGGKEDVRPFIAVAEYLRGHDFSAPEIFAQDAALGFLLLEDLGDNAYGAYLASRTSPKQEMELYQPATELLARLHALPPLASLPPYHEEALLTEAYLLTDWYLPHTLGIAPASVGALRQEYTALWKKLFPVLKRLPEVVVLRDYHSPNLLWLPERTSYRKVGVIDFQDAVLGSPAYDIVSLLEDARRDVHPATAATLLEHYLTLRPEWHREDFLAAYAILGAQRNCKILGFTARKLLRDHNPNYLHLVPRMWRYLEHDLQHPLLAPLKQWLHEIIPSEIRNQKSEKGQEQACSLPLF